MNNKIRRISFVLALLSQVLSPGALRATGAFSEAGVEFPFLRNGAAAWGDYDNDGYLDLVVTGLGSALPYVSEIWRNNGNNTFSNINANLGPHALGAVAWVDLDNDGYLDLIVTGKTNSPASDYSTEIWKNRGGTNFIRVPNNIRAGSLGTIAVGDFDNDGRQDFIVATAEGSSANSINRNLANFGFSDVGLPTFENPGAGFVQLVDTDNDGWLDVFVAGDPDVAGPTEAITKLYRNLNGLALTNTVVLPGAGNARGGFADYNHDGRLDLLTTATSGAGTNAHVWFNDGAGFLESGSVFPFASFGGGCASASWGDFNNDGLPDIFLMWRAQLGRIFQNNDDGTFTDLNVGFPVPNNTASVQVGESGDFNNDGKLDLLVSVSSLSYPGNWYRLYRNDTAISNTPPGAPSGLRLESLPEGTNATLRWLAASDAETPEAGLSYNLRVGSTPGGCDIVSPMADAISGRRRIPALGNAQSRRFALLRKLPAGMTFYWSVQAIDSAFAGGAWAAEATFTTRVPAAGDTDGDGIVTRTEFDSVLANYLADSPYLRITNAAGLGGSNVTFELTNDIAGTFSVEYSTNLMDWHFLGTAAPRYLFTDPNAPAIPQRSYRLRWP